MTVDEDRHECASAGEALHLQMHDLADSLRNVITIAGVNEELRRVQQDLAKSHLYRKGTWTSCGAMGKGYGMRICEIEDRDMERAAQIILRERTCSYHRLAEYSEQSRQAKGEQLHLLELFKTTSARDSERNYQDELQKVVRDTTFFRTGAHTFTFFLTTKRLTEFVSDGELKNLKELNFAVKKDGEFLNPKTVNEDARFAFMNLDKLLGHFIAATALQKMTIRYTGFRRLYANAQNGRAHIGILGLSAQDAELLVKTEMTYEGEPLIFMKVATTPDQETAQKPNALDTQSTDPSIEPPKTKTRLSENAEMTKNARPLSSTSTPAAAAGRSMQIPFRSHDTHNTTGATTRARWDHPPIVNEKK